MGRIYSKLMEGHCKNECSQEFKCIVVLHVSEILGPIIKSPENVFLLHLRDKVITTLLELTKR